MRYEDLKQRALKGPKPVVALVEAADEAALKALYRMKREKLADALLIGDSAKISRSLQELNWDFPNESIINVHNSAEAIDRACRAVREKEADLIMKGKIGTGDLMKGVLKKQNGFVTGSLLTHVAVFQVPVYDRLLCLSDTGLVIQPSFEERVAIVRNAIDFMRRAGIEKPNVGLVSATEKPNPAMPDSLDAARIMEMADRGVFHGANIQGPIDVSIALSPEAARIKNVDDSFSGKFDIWIVPDMIGGNILGKTLIHLAGAEAGGVIVGGRTPIVLLSRASSDADKFNSILLGLIGVKTAE